MNQLRRERPQLLDPMRRRAPRPARWWWPLLCAGAVACGEAEPDDQAKDAELQDTAAFEVSGADTAATDSATPKADAAVSFDSAAPLDSFAPRWPDAGECKPACALGDGTPKVCGPDGCGSVCGFCKSGQFCAADQTSCGAFCQASCGGKKCGPDGCGGQCGECAKGTKCAKDGLCYEEDCQASCKDRVCGDDGCGNSCGLCAKADFCDAAGQCKPGPCKGIPDAGKCDGAILVSCKGQGGQAVAQNVDCAAKGQLCGWNPTLGAYSCVPKGTCTPQCKTASGQTKECGSDGCDGVCGQCPEGWSCPGGLCQPEKGAACGALITAQGKCVGDQWVFCSGGKVAIIDCQSVSQKCGWNASAAKFGCM